MFSCGHLVDIGFPYCSFKPGVLLWRLIEYLYFILLVWASRCLVATYWIVVYFILLVWARRSLVAIYCIFVFLVARLSQPLSCGHLLNICVLHIARLSQAFSWGHLVNIGFPYCSFEPGVLLWRLIEYLYFILLVWARRSLVAIYCIFVFLIARLSQPLSCGHLLNSCVFHIARLSQAFSCGH